MVISFLIVRNCFLSSFRSKLQSIDKIISSRALDFSKLDSFTMNFESVHNSFNDISILDCNKRKIEWIDLCCDPDELLPQSTLNIGQCFNWKQFQPNYWVGMINTHPVIIRYHNNITQFCCLITRPDNAEKSLKISKVKYNEDIISLLQEYFQLKHNLKDLYSLWSLKCNRMDIITNHLRGIF
jgi:hypothetical protein